MDIRYYKHALIINKEPSKAFIGVSTFWTPKDKVNELISEENKKKVLVVAQLYTYEGMKYLEYNVFANPNFQILIFTGFDNNKIIPRIKSQERGVLDYPEYEDMFWEYWGKGIDIDISYEVVGNMIFLKDYKDIDKLISELKPRKNWIEKPIIIPPPIKSSFDTLDSEKTGFVVRDSNLYRLWQQGLMRIKLFGTMVDGTREVMNLVSVLTSEPKLHPSFPAVEQAEQYLPQVCDEKPTTGLVYTYGSRLHEFGQISSIIKSLSEGLFNRNGVSSTWQGEIDFGHPPPCLVLATFRIHPIGKSLPSTNAEFKEYLKVHKPSKAAKIKPYAPVINTETKSCESSLDVGNSKISFTQDETHTNTFTHVLYMNTVFRSHDYYKGMPMNLWALWYLGQKVINAVQSAVGDDIRIKHGPLTNLSIAAHVYEQDFKKLEGTRMIYTELDPRGYFTISLLRDEKKLRVALMSNTNREIEVWESDSTQELSNKIQIYISDVSHALYMGRELEKAKQHLLDGTPYKQD